MMSDVPKLELYNLHLNFNLHRGSSGLRLNKLPEELKEHFGAFLPAGIQNCCSDSAAD